MSQMQSVSAVEAAAACDPAGHGRHVTSRPDPHRYSSIRQSAYANSFTMTLRALSSISNMDSHQGLLSNHSAATPRVAHVPPQLTTPRSSPVCMLKVAIFRSMKRQCTPLKRQIALRCRTCESSTRASVLRLFP
eukprot:2814429-Rhodomonas_salina.1